MILRAQNEKQDKGNLGQTVLSDNTKVDFGVIKDHVSNGSFKGNVQRKIERLRSNIDNNHIKYSKHPRI